MKKTIKFLAILISAITIIGAISTEDVVFVVAGLINIISFGKDARDFIQTNSGPINNTPNK